MTRMVNHDLELKPKLDAMMMLEDRSLKKSATRSKRLSWCLWRCLTG